MELIIILTVILIILITGYYVFDIQIKKIKEVGYNEKYNKIASKFPANKEICEDVLKKLNNTKVKIKEEESTDQKATTSLYVAISDTIYIGNIKNTYTRIQTICHECIHSVQPRRLLIFNFIYSNIYIIYFAIATLLVLFGIIKDIKLHVVILSILSFFHYSIRSYLETDAMIKAKFVAKDYMLGYIQKEPICTKEEVEDIEKQYEQINKLGIPAYNYILFLKNITKIMIFIIISIIKLALT